MSARRIGIWPRSFFDAAPDTRAFSAGVAVEEHVPETVFQMLDSFHSVFRLLAQNLEAVIAVVNGPALGGGCELVAACDIVIASERARFGTTGDQARCLSTGGGDPFCRASSGKTRARIDHVGDMIDAAEAFAPGSGELFSAAAELEAKVNECAGQVAGSFRGGIGP